MEKEFEEFWTGHRKQLIDKAPRHFKEERNRNLGMNTLGDWLLWIVPVAVAVWMMEYKFVSSGIINVLIMLAICVACVTICQMIRPYVTGKRNVADIDEEIKQYYYHMYCKNNGKIDL